MIVIFALAMQLFLQQMPTQTRGTHPSVFLENEAKLPILLEKTDISGQWEGTITRDEGGGKRTVFKMELDLMQKGKDVTGTSYVHAEGEKRTYSANMSLAGRANKTYFKYQLSYW